MRTVGRVHITAPCPAEKHRQCDEERAMKSLLIITTAFLATTATALAQSAPDLKGTWSGSWKTVIYGSNPHHPGSETTASAPRIREIAFTLEVEGQDGRLIWGRSWSNPAQKELFAATIAADGKTILGADTDGSLTMTITASDKIEACYVHSGLSPTKSIVASCGSLQRAGR
jgi:hypothetical protein